MSQNKSSKRPHKRRWSLRLGLLILVLLAASALFPSQALKVVRWLIHWVAAWMSDHTAQCWTAFGFFVFFQIVSWSFHILADKKVWMKVLTTLYVIVWIGYWGAIVPATQWPSLSFIAAAILGLIVIWPCGVAFLIWEWHERRRERKHSQMVIDPTKPDGSARPDPTAKPHTNRQSHPQLPSTRQPYPPQPPQIPKPRYFSGSHGEDD